MIDLKTLEDINIELAEAAEELRQERINVMYNDFLEEMHYILECNQWERDNDLYNELG